MTRTVIDGVVLTPKILDTLRQIQGQDDCYGDYLDEITDLLINDYRKLDVKPEDVLRYIKILRIVAYDVLANLIPDFTEMNKPSEEVQNEG